MEEEGGTEMFLITSTSKSQTMLWVSFAQEYSFCASIALVMVMKIFIWLNPGGGYGNKSGGPNSWGSPGGPGQPAYGSAEYWQQYQQYQQQYQQWQVLSQCSMLMLNTH